MRIVCIGGGPAGLYFGLLMKKLHPAHAVTVVERNRPYDTFGWGVVFSDATMDSMKAWDPETADAIQDAFNHWDDIEVWFKGTQAAHHRPRLRRHRPQEAAQHPAGALRAAGRRAGVRARRRVRSRIPRRRPDHRLGRVQLEDPQPLPGGVPARPGHAAQPLHLARHQQALRRLHLRLPPHRPRLVPGAHLQVRRPDLDLHRRDHRGGVRGAWPGPARPGRLDRLLRAAVRGGARWRDADDQRAPPARLGLAQLPAPDLRQLEPFQRHARTWC